MKVFFRIALFLTLALLGHFSLLDAEPSSTGALPAATPSVDELIQSADAVIQATHSNQITAARNWRVVVAAASALQTAGRIEDALKYRQQAASLAPFDLENQLAMAKIEAELGHTKEAERIARLVWDQSESDKLLRGSSSILGVLPAWHVPTWEERPRNEKIICIVTLGLVEPWVVHAAADALQQNIGLKVVARPGLAELGKPDRSNAELMAAKFRESLLWGNPIVQKVMEDLEIKSRESASDAQIIKLVTTLLIGSGASKQAEEITRSYASAREQGQQWSINSLWKKLTDSIESDVSEDVIWVGITSVDIFSPDTHYVFANSSNAPYPIALVSYARFKAAFWNVAEDQQKFRARLQKQLLSSFAYTLKVSRCSDPRCVRAYPACLEDLDAKGSHYCPACREIVGKALNRILPNTAKVAGQ